MRSSRLGALALLLLTTCGGGNASQRELRAVDFDHTCVRSSDCASIFEGTIQSCTKVPCANAAIAMSSLPTYTIAVNARLGPCTDVLPSECNDNAVTCPAGTCEFHKLPFGQTLTPGITAADYPQNCEDVADCLPIFEGPLSCCDLACTNAAINVSAEAQWKADVDRRTPICDGAPTCRKPASPTATSACHGRVGCENGSCVVLTATP
jgi:hypothetical protein